ELAVGDRLHLLAVDPGVAQPEQRDECEHHVPEVELPVRLHRQRRLLAAVAWLAIHASMMALGVPRWPGAVSKACALQAAISSAGSPPSACSRSAISGPSSPVAMATSASKLWSCCSSDCSTPSSSL